MRNTTFDLQPASAPQPLLPFLLSLVGYELLRAHGAAAGEWAADRQHPLAWGQTSWRPAEAWQAIADGAVSLLRRLLLLDAWR